MEILSSTHLEPGVLSFARSTGLPTQKRTVSPARPQIGGEVGAPRARPRKGQDLPEEGAKLWPRCSHCHVEVMPGARCLGPRFAVRVCSFTQVDDQGRLCMSGGTIGEEGEV